MWFHNCTHLFFWTWINRFPCQKTRILLIKRPTPFSLTPLKRCIPASLQYMFLENVVFYKIICLFIAKIDLNGTPCNLLDKTVIFKDNLVVLHVHPTLLCVGCVCMVITSSVW